MSLAPLPTMEAEASIPGTPGGIQFDVEAAPPPGNFRVDSVQYDRSKPDGQRLRLTISSDASGTEAYAPALYDWQLLPIARYVNSDNQLCIDIRNGEEIQIHPAFKDTLLGLRLLQADLLLLTRSAADLFKNDNQFYIFESSESAPTKKQIDKNKQNFEAVNDFKCRLENEHKLPFKSYTITAPAEPVSLQIINKKIVLGGEPFWNIQAAPRDIHTEKGILDWDQKVEAEALNTSFDCYVAVLLIRAHEDQLDAIEQQCSTVPSLSLLHRWESTSSRVLHKIKTQLSRASGSRLVPDGLDSKASLWDLLEKLRKLPPSDPVLEQTKKVFEKHRESAQQIRTQVTKLEVLKQPSVELTNKISEMNGINPTVYAALRQTMRYSAFLRLVKRKNPPAFATFVNSLPPNVIWPDTTTPTHVPKFQR